MKMKSQNNEYKEPCLVLPFKTFGSHFCALLYVYSPSISWRCERANGVKVLWSVFSVKAIEFPQMWENPPFSVD